MPFAILRFMWPWHSRPKGPTGIFPALDGKSRNFAGIDGVARGLPAIDGAARTFGALDGKSRPLAAIDGSMRTYGRL